MLSFYIVTLFIVTVAARSPPMPGGIHETEETDDVRAAAHFATNEINKEMRTPEVQGQNWFTLTKINDPTAQVVRGVIYEMEIVLRQSDCLNRDINLSATIKQCPPQQNGFTRRCKVSVLHGIMDEGHTLRSHHCTVNK